MWEISFDGNSWSCDLLIRLLSRGRRKSIFFRLAQHQRVKFKPLVIVNASELKAKNFDPHLFDPSSYETCHLSENT